ncbi:MAG: hypothetical protein RIM84_18910 [Alphaproteobacteria bacterium]
MTSATASLLHREIEQLDAGDMRAMQHRKLSALGERLAQSPEWITHFKTGGVHPRDLADPQALASVPPFLDKTMLRERYPIPMLTTDVNSASRFWCAASSSIRRRSRTSSPRPRVR